MHPSNLPDLPHIYHIRQRLWEGRVFGRAAVMVGAGFSLNAESRSFRADSFPLWKELARHMYDALYPTSVDTPEHKDATRFAAANGGIMQLALEFETAFGRPALDRLILDAIPDDDYEPGDLHRLLLSLPWSDVFTTNYDTLLDRACLEVSEQKYDVVRTAEDLSTSAKPRIVKLHGSLKSVRRFIITTEDYRKYPRDFAPFVSTVRQSLMENTFVLLGFSGDDPNFHRWLGWVRDELGSSRPSVYLCGVLDLTPAKRRVLEMHHVIPVDIGPLIPERGPKRHEKALRWLLCSLWNGRPPSLLSWPESEVPESEAICSFAPDSSLLPLERDAACAEHVEPNRKEPESNNLDALVERWAINRRAYPGWVITPKKNRSVLWRRTENWLPIVFKRLHELDALRQLQLLYELVWRLDRIMLPVNDEQAEVIESVLEETIECINGNSQETAVARRQWVELAFALARRMRHEGRDNAFMKWTGHLEAVAATNSNWNARRHYELCLYHLGRGSFEMTRRQLDRWPDIKGEPFWDVWRAAVLAEIGDLDEASDLASSALARIREQTKPTVDDYVLLSQEGLARMLVRFIETSQLQRKDVPTTARDRWDVLSGYRCDPRDELQMLNLELEMPLPRPRKHKQITTDSFTGEKSTRYIWSAEAQITLKRTDYLPAYSVIRLFEEGGIPFRIRVTQSGDVVKAAGRLAELHPMWMTSVFVRTGISTGISEEAQQHFGRVLIASLSNDEVEWMARVFMGGLEETVEAFALRKGPRSEGSGYVKAGDDADLFVLLLSRIAFRLSELQRREIINLACVLYTDTPERERRILEGSFRKLLGRLFEDASPELTADLLPRLLSLPLQEIPLPEWPEPLGYVPLCNLPRLNKCLAEELESSDVDKLIEHVESSGDHLRSRAIVRLERLYRAGLLSDKQEEWLAKAVWERKDPETGLPELEHFYPWVVLALPEPDEGYAAEQLRTYLVSTDPGRLSANGRVEPGSQPTVGDGSQLLSMLRSWYESTEPLDPHEQHLVWREREKRRWVEWNESDAVRLLEWLQQWWEDEGVYLLREQEKQDPRRQEIFRNAFEGVPALIRRVVLPNLPPGAQEEAQLVIKILKEMIRAGLPARSALPEMLRFLDNADEVATEIRKGLGALDEEVVSDAAEAVYRWIVGSQRWGFSPAPDSLLDELVNHILTRRQPGLEETLHWISEIYQYSEFTRRQKETLCEALALLHDETEPPSLKERLMGREEPTRTELIRRPYLRAQGVRLASRIDHSPLGLGEEPSSRCTEMIRAWETSAKESVYPSVRRAWQEAVR